MKPLAPFISILCALCALCGQQVQAVEPPNFLFIIADDLGWADVGYHGSDIDTPNIDQLARRGVIMENHYVTPMCSSTRACLQSGRFSTRFGLDSATNSQVYPFGMTTLASALKSAGYETCLTGKWHLGSKPESGPLQFGFTRSHGSFAGGVDQYSHLYKTGPFQKTWHRNDEYVDEEGHATDLFARQAIEWIEKFAAKPWFIQVAFTAVHIPIQEPEEWIKPYEGRIANESRRRYAACATHMDDAIGQMVKALERTGQRENTLIVFTSDNGGAAAWAPEGKYPGTYLASPVLGNNLPLRGGKGTVYEGGIRVPAFANWPGRLEPLKLNHPIHMVDWMPTLLGLTGHGFPHTMAEELRWDGHDVWPLLAGKEKFPESRLLYFKRGDNYAVRKGRWKLVQSGETKTELFDLNEDPYEKEDLTERLPERLATMQPLLEEQRSLDKSGPMLKLN